MKLCFYELETDGFEFESKDERASDCNEYISSMSLRTSHSFFLNLKPHRLLINGMN